MIRILFSGCLLFSLAGCSLVFPSLPENPDKENFNTEYVQPDFSAEEEKLRRGE